MATIYKFPAKDERRWAGIFEEITVLLFHLGATRAEIDQLKTHLRERWEALGKPFDIQVQHQLVGPLSEEQLESINLALQAQAVEISNHLKIEHAATLIEFAKLEFELVRLKRDEQFSEPIQ
jgi:hypothetical protein